MSTTIDERVVAMKFQNSDFNTKIKSTLDSLASLKGALNMDAGRKSIEDLDAAGKKFNLTGMGDATDGISAKFIAMASVAITAIANITNRAVDAGIQLAKSFTVDPVKNGLAEYETNLNSIQTILSNTSAKGTTLDQVNAALQQLNNYSDKTIYNFSEMARNIGTFTAAGVGLDTSVNAIKGIANLAAISGSNSQQASTAMYQLSQALATGTVKLMDWNSVVNAGMGGEVFQNALKDTARAHGIAVDDMIKKNGSFRDSLQEGWLSAEVLTETLSKFTGDLSAEQLKQMGYTDEQIVGILEMGQTAMHAAQDVKTFSQLLDTTKEALGSGWSQTWQIVFGDFGEAKELWTSVSNAINGVVGASADARNKMLQDWKTLGGRTALIETIKNILAALSNVIAPIKDAFRQVFPPTTGAQLYGITKALLDFSQKLKDGTSGLESIKPLFTALFSVLKFGLSIVQAAAKGVGILLGLFVGGAGAGIIGIANSLSVIVQRITDWVNKTGLVEKFFTILAESRAATLGPILDFVNRIAAAFAALSSGDKTAFIEQLKNSFQAFAPWGDKVTGVLDTVRDAFGKVGGYAKSFGSDVQGGFGKAAQYVAAAAEAISGFAARLSEAFRGVWDSVFGAKGAVQDVEDTAVNAGDRIREVWSGVGKFFAEIGDFLAPAKDAIGRGLTWIKDKITEFVSGLSAQDALALVNTGLFMSMYIGIKKVMDSLKEVFDGVGNFVNPLSSVFENLGGALKGLQNEANAKAILNIAIAVGVLAGTAMALSLVDPASLGIAGGAIVALIGTLIGTMAAFEKISGDASVVKIGALAGALLLISNAVIILAGAIAIFGAMDPASVGIGLGFMVATLGVVVGAVFALSKITGSMVASAAALVVLSLALTSLAGVIALFALFDVATVAEGLGYMAATLAALGLAMQFMPPNMLLTSVALVAVAVALGMLSGTLKVLATMSFGDIAKSLITLAGALGIISIAMIAMTGTLAGAAALMVTTLALGMFVPILVTLGNLDLQTIGVGLLAIAAVFAVIGVAGLVLAPVVPVLLGLGVALGLMGVGALAAGVGIFAFANAMGVLAAIGATGIAGLTAVIVGLAELFPLIMQQIGLGLRAFAVVISESGPEIVGALTTLLISLLQAIENASPQFFDTVVTFLTGLLDAIQVVAPKAIETLVILIEALVEAVVELVPMFVDAGLRLLTGILDGIANNIGNVVESATDIVVNFLDAIGDNIPRIIQSGVDLLISFLEGIEKAIRDNSQRVTDAGLGIGDAIVDGVKNAITAGVSKVTGAVKNLGSSALNGLKGMLGIKSPSREFYKLGDYSVQGFSNALTENSDMAEKAAANLGKRSTQGLKDGLAGFAASAVLPEKNNPVITPVVDLSNVDKAAEDVRKAFDSKVVLAPISSYAQAKGVQTEINSIADVRVPKEYDVSPTNVTFNQYNTSPKAISNAELYRQTKSQLSLVKGGLPR